MNSVINHEFIQRALEEHPIEDLSRATIREIVTVVNKVEKYSQIPFVRMEMGVPGLPPSKVAVEAEIKALKKGVASQYPMLEGIVPLKEEASRFIKAFVNIDVSPEGCIPTVGAMQGSYAVFKALGKVNKNKDTFLFIEPGFPVQKQQIAILGYKSVSFDIYNYRGKKIREQLNNILSKNNICAIVYSNPNNPTWVCLREDELQIIGELANKYDVTVVEDLAYFAMDFRNDKSIPFQEPYQPSVANHTDNYILLISGSKIFSYAGQRIGVMAISDVLFNRYYDNLKKYFGRSKFGRVIIGRILYALSSGASHSAQYGLAEAMKQASDGNYNFLTELEEYRFRAAEIKKIFLKYDFSIVYDKDLDVPIADGFYFTFTYKNLTSEKLLYALLHYGVSAIALKNTGSKKEGLRACVSQINANQFDALNERLKLFSLNINTFNY